VTDIADDDATDTADDDATDTVIDMLGRVRDRALGVLSG
jgi:hypothetical protein